MAGAAGARVREGAGMAKGDRAQLRAWLEYVAQTAIDWLDELDAAEAELEDDEREIVAVDDRPALTVHQGGRR